MYQTCPNCYHPIAQAFFDSAVQAICPNCYTVIQLVRKAEAQPNLSAQDKTTLNVIAGLAVGVFIGKLLFS